MTLINKNTIPTSFTIDLSTIDKKVEKLIKYFQNCDVDLKRQGLRFVNPDVQYSFLKKSLENKKYKESLSKKVDEIYFNRFILTAVNLTLKGVAKPEDFLIPGALDDFGSRFDAFAATNTNPDNLVLKLLNIKPYKYLKVDLLTKKELEIYTQNIQASYEYERLSYLSQKLSYITSQFLESTSENTANYITRIQQEILTVTVVKYPEKQAPSSQQDTGQTEEQPGENTGTDSQTGETPSAQQVAANPAAPPSQEEEVKYYTIEDRDKQGVWDDDKKIWTTRIYDTTQEGSLNQIKGTALIEAANFVEGIIDLGERSFKKTIRDPRNTSYVRFEMSGKGLIKLPDPPVVKPPDPPFMSDQEYKDLLESSGQQQPEQLPSTPQSPVTSIVDVYPELSRATQLFDAFTSTDFVFLRQDERDFEIRKIAYDELKKVDSQLAIDMSKNPNKIYDTILIEKTKIKILNNIISEVFRKNLEAKLYQLENLIDYRSSYAAYNFYDKQFILPEDLELPEVEPAKKEELIFKITYLREETQNLINQEEQKQDDLKIEFVSTDSITLGNPFANSSIKNNKFIAILDGFDLSLGAPVEFFEPTILSLLSDIDYIDSNLKEIDITYCPTPQSLSPSTKIKREEYLKNEVVKDIVTGEKNSITELDAKIFNFKTFPDSYFTPNFFPQSPEQIRIESFFEKIDKKLTRSELDEQIKKYSKYYYTTQNDTPSAKLARDANMSVLMTDTLNKNSFYGTFEPRKDSFSLPEFVKQTIDLIRQQGANAGASLDNIIFAKTNIACLLKEFQTCFLPKIPSCKDVLRGFRFSDLENLLTKVAPQSLYPVLYESINRLRSDLIKDQREKELLEELNALEERIKNNERKKLVFEKLDQRVRPDIALNQVDAELGIGPKDLSLKQAYKNKLKEYKEYKLSTAFIQEASLSESQIAQDADKFLDLLEQNGINIESLCDLANLLIDLSGISFTFGKLALPQLPQIDLFQEVKLSLDLSIIQIILQAVIEFILKLLQELLSCSGLKNLIEAGLTGETENMGLAATTAGALNQMINNNFDLDDFVDNNPQIDPRQFKKNIENTLSMLTGSIQAETTTQLNVSADLGPIPLQIGGVSKEKVDILRLSNSSIETEQELYSSFTQLITGLSSVLPKTDFIDLIGGNPSDNNLRAVSFYITTEQPELSFIAEPSRIRNIFRFIGETSGLKEMREELYSVATAYVNKIQITKASSFCEPEVVVSGTISTTETQVKKILNPYPERTPEKVYGEIMKDLLSVSPENIKSLLDEKVFKPIIIGKLPNGQKIKEVDQSQKRTIKRTLKPISDKFKKSANSFYSNLPLRKKVEREIPKYIIKQNEQGEEIKIDNPEFKDKVNTGIGKQDAQDLELIKVEENKYVYGALFKEPFVDSARTFNIQPTDEALNISISGKRGQISPNISGLLSSVLGNSYDTWKVVSEQTKEKRTIKLIEDGGLAIGQNEVFSYSMSGSNEDEISQINILNNEYIQLLQSSLTSSIEISSDATFISSSQKYFNDSYDRFLSYIYKKITQKISDDSLLKEIDLSLLDTNTPTLTLLLPLLNIPASIPLSYNENPNIDTPLKYINFSPKQTDQQKLNDADPSLFGLKEISKLVSGIVDKRNNELLENFSDLEKLIEDKDNALDLSLIDGLYMSLIRTACSDLCFKSLFALRTFKYEKSLLNDLLLPNFVSDMLYKEISYFSSVKSKKSIMTATRKHIDYLHNYVFETLPGEEDVSFLLDEIDELKNINESLSDDARILNMYKNDLNRNTASVLGSQNESDEQFNQKIDNLISCLKDEIQQNQIKILKLQLRNLAYNELSVIFDKLSYITSTNPKITQLLPANCRDEVDGENKDFLVNFLPNALVDSQINSIPTTPNERESRVSTLIKYRKELLTSYSQNDITIEYYINLGISSRDKFPGVYTNQALENMFGVQSIDSVINFLEFIDSPALVTEDMDISNLFPYFSLGMRLVYIPNKKPNMNSAVLYDTKKTIKENIQEIIRTNKNKFYYSDNSYSDFKEISIGPFGSLPKPKNLLDKTYSVPYIFKEKDDTDTDENNPLLIGLLNVIPLFVEETPINLGSYNIKQLIEELKNIKEKKSNIYLNTRINLLCNEKLKEFYNILSNKNLLSNMIILSSIGVLSNEPIKSIFGSIRSKVLNDILVSLNSLENKNNFDEILEGLLDVNYFKDFNAADIIKVTLEAAVYVLQYYCQMTDPNISQALILRNAVKILLNFATQLPVPLPGVPKEIPPPLNALALYSMAQLPVNLFGIPPAGIGVGPPITIPGMVLLAVEIILLASEISITFDSNDGEDQIKDLLKRYCIDLHGYKKYGTE